MKKTKIDCIECGGQMEVQPNIEDGMYDYMCRLFDYWRFDLPLVNLFEIVHISNLRRLCHTLAMTESFVSIVIDGIFCIFSQSTVNQETANQRPSSSLACVTVYDHNILLFF
jgi:hypothetical protein